MRSTSPLFFRTLFLVGISTTLSPLAMSQKPETETPNPSIEVPLPASPETARWDYEQHGPDHWAELSPAFQTCGSGQFQSPIDLNPKVTISTAPVSVHWNAAPLDLLDNGHCIEVRHRSAGTSSIADTTYELLQWHVHRPSEHTVNGQHAALEFHFVHQDVHGNLAVMGVLVDEGAHHIAADQLVNHLDAVHQGHETLWPLEKINPNSFLPKVTEHYDYYGSLTTPPCSEGVRWMVFRDHLQMDASQIQAIAARHSHNARPVHPREPSCLTPDDACSR